MKKKMRSEENRRETRRGQVNLFFKYPIVVAYCFFSILSTQCMHWHFWHVLANYFLKAQTTLWFTKKDCPSSGLVLSISNLFMSPEEINILNLEIVDNNKDQIDAQEQTVLDFSALSFPLK